MTDEDAKAVRMRVSLWDRTDGMRTLGCVGPNDMSTREWKIGDTLTLTVIGVERVGWEGTEVQ